MHDDIIVFTVIGMKGLHLQIVVNSTPNWKTNEYIPPFIWTNKWTLYWIPLHIKWIFVLSSTPQLYKLH